MIGLEMTEPMIVSAVMIEVLRRYCQKGKYSTASRKFDQANSLGQRVGRIDEQLLVGLERGHDHPVEREQKERADEDEDDSGR